jgi:predicted 3-demethylubiquinone-9 3-methyltransferase (glyoxalase superfamily)
MKLNFHLSIFHYGVVLNSTFTLSDIEVFIMEKNIYKEAGYNLSFSYGNKGFQ